MWAPAHFFVVCAREKRVSGVESVRNVVEPLVRARRCSLYDLEVSRHGRTQLVRVYIDRPGGVDTDTCATVSRLVARALDEAELVAGGYTLEVSSPGLERALRRPEHFAGIVGTDLRARVKLRSSVLEGMVTEADEDGFRLETSDGEVDVRYEDVVSARTVFTWGSREKAGTTKGARA